jgi:hypothetical protein
LALLLLLGRTSGLIGLPMDSQKFREEEEMNEKKEAALNKEKEKNTNLHKFIDELRSKISEKEINLGAVNDNLKNTTVSKEKTDDKAIHCEFCEKKFGNADQLKKHMLSVHLGEAGTENERQRKGHMEQITRKFCQQIPAHIDLLHYIKEDNSSQPGKDIENSNMPLIHDIKNSIRIMFKEEKIEELLN